MPHHGHINTHNLLPNHLKGQRNAHSHREAALLDMMNYQSHTTMANSTVQDITILGWTEDSIFDVEVVDRRSKSYHLSMVTGTVNIKPSADGSVFYPVGTFNAILAETSGPVDHTGDGYMIHQGEVTFEFHIPKHQVNVEEITLHTWSHDSTPFQKEVYNWIEDTFDPYEDVFTKNKLSGELIKKYLSPDGELRIKMNHTQQGHRHLGQPAISVEGKVVQHD